MGLLNKINPGNTEIVRNRFIGRFNHGWETMGKRTFEPDNRSVEQIKNNIDLFASRYPEEIKTFIKDIKSMKPKHMRLMSDVLETVDKHVLLSEDARFNKDMRKILVQDIVEAAKENPESLELVDAVISNTDTLNSKYFLGNLLGGILKDKSVAKQMQETAKVVPDIAKETLEDGYSMDFKNQKNFMNWIKYLVNPEVKADKITSLFKDVVAFCNKRPASENIEIDVYKYLTSKTPVSKVKENLKALENSEQDLSKINFIDTITK